MSCASISPPDGSGVVSPVAVPVKLKKVLSFFILWAVLAASDGGIAVSGNVTACVRHIVIPHDLI